MASTGENVCWCSSPSRGDVDVDENVPAHTCGGCSAEHCRLVEIVRGCQFGICRSQAEVELPVVDGDVPVRVCELHVTPMLEWVAS